MGVLLYGIFAVDAGKLESWLDTICVSNLKAGVNDTSCALCNVVLGRP